MQANLANLRWQWSGVCEREQQSMYGRIKDDALRLMEVQCTTRNLSYNEYLKLAPSWVAVCS